MGDRKEPIDELVDAVNRLQVAVDRYTSPLLPFLMAAATVIAVVVAMVGTLWWRGLWP